MFEKAGAANLRQRIFPVYRASKLISVNGLAGLTKN